MRCAAVALTLYAVQNTDMLCMITLARLSALAFARDILV